MPVATSPPAPAAAHRGSRAAAARRLSPSPLFDSPSLIALLTEHGIKPKWATLIQQTLLHHTPQLTHPTPSPLPSDSSASSSTACPSSHHLSALDCDRVWQSLAERFSAPSSCPPAGLFPLLQSRTTLLSSRVCRAETSADGSTTKLLVELADGQLVESVIMRHRGKETSRGDDEEEAAEEAEQESKQAAVQARRTRRSAGRVTLCVSSQIGCRQACSFCATGSLGLKGSLMAGEIVEQLLHANRLLAAAAAAPSSSPPVSVSNVVYMGQGEPLDNYEAVLASIRCLTSPQLFRLSPARITVSTVGLTSRILALARDAPHVQLALSLHAPSQSLRLQLVPSSSAYTLPKLLSSLQQYIAVTGNTVLIQYILLAGVNSSVSQAEQLTALLQPLLPRVKLNLIPYNATEAGAGYTAPSRETVLLFQRRVQQAGIFCSVRQEMGSDVNGACGQLALKQTAEAGPSRQQGTTEKEGRVADIEDLACQRGGQGMRRRPPLRSQREDRRREEEGSCKDESAEWSTERRSAVAAAAVAKLAAGSAELSAASPVVHRLRTTVLVLAVLLVLLLLLLWSLSSPFRSPAPT